MGKKSSRATRLCDTPVACLDEGAERFQFLQTLISIGGGRPLSPTTITHWKQWVFSYLGTAHAAFDLSAD